MKRLLLAILLICAGCASSTPRDNVPSYPLLDDRAMIAAVSSSLHQVHDLSAQGFIELSEAGGDRVRLNAAFVMCPPNQARLRAWKFGQAVFDLTIRPDGAWLASDRDHAGKIQVSASQLAHSLAMLNGEFLDSPDLRLHDEDGELIAERARPGEPNVVCIIDRTTRTIRRYTVEDDQKRKRLSLDQMGF
ncbi:MAG: hypothetical protein JO353_10105, partial [Phycisphaerae bacterium]|nr:hypothetical protein [Phycisphaerae bacterium]